MRGESDRLFPQAQMLIDLVMSGKNVAIVSDLILLETIDVPRKRIAKNSQAGAPEDHAAIQRKIHTITGDFLDAACKVERTDMSSYQGQISA